MGDDVAKDGAYRIVCTKETERRMGDIVAEDGGIGSFVRRKRGGGLEGRERLYGAVGENSIDFLKILYRLFRKNLSFRSK